MKRIAVLVALLAAALASTARADHLANPTHWASDGEEVRVPILVYGLDDTTNLADAAATWSAAIDGLEVGIAGEATAGDCDLSVSPRGPGKYITFCAGTGSGAAAAIGSECSYKVKAGIYSGFAECSDSDWGHIGGVVINTQSSNPGIRTTTHELGHALGLAHGGGGVMEQGTSAICPSGSDISHLSGAYAHDDGYVWAAQHEWIVTGSDRCSGGGGGDDGGDGGGNGDKPKGHGGCPPGWAKKGRC